jgi:hypothetical protein
VSRFDFVWRNERGPTLGIPPESIASEAPPVAPVSMVVAA